MGWGGRVGVGWGWGAAASVDRHQQVAALTSVDSQPGPATYLCRACPLESDSIVLSTHLSPCPSPTPPPLIRACLLRGGMLPSCN